jgi:transposase
MVKHIHVPIQNQRSESASSHGVEEDAVRTALTREPDLTLAEICDRLERVRGEKVSPSMIWRFFDRHDITFKKSRRTRANKTVPTSVSGVGNGLKANSISIR